MISHFFTRPYFFDKKDVYKRQGQILPGMCRTHEADQRRKAQAETTGEMSRFRG